MKIESLEIEARASSVPFARSGNRKRRKGIPPKWKILPGFFLLGRQRTSAGLSQKLLWSAIEAVKFLYLLGRGMGV